MKSFIILFAKSLPLAIGLVMALLSIAFTVNVTEQDYDAENNIAAALFCGIIGYPLLISGALSLIKKSKDI